MPNIVSTKGPYQTYFYESSEADTIGVPNLDVSSTPGTWVTFAEAIAECAGFIKPGYFSTCKIEDATKTVVWTSYPAEFDGEVVGDIERIVSLMYDDEAVEISGLTNDERDKLYTSLRKLKRLLQEE